MSKGGAAPYRKGAAYEREIQHHLEAEGWLVVRQPKSQSPFDLMAYRDQVLWLVQCKLRGRLPKSEKEALVSLAMRFGNFVVPVLAYKDEKGDNCLITLP